VGGRSLIVDFPVPLSTVSFSSSSSSFCELSIGVYRNHQCLFFLFNYQFLVFPSSSCWWTSPVPFIVKIANTHKRTPPVEDPRQYRTTCSVAPLTTKAPTNYDTGSTLLPQTKRSRLRQEHLRDPNTEKTQYHPSSSDRPGGRQNPRRGKSISQTEHLGKAELSRSH